MNKVKYSLLLSISLLLLFLFNTVFAIGPISGDFRVNTGTSATQYESKIGMDADGDSVVVWEGQQAGNGDIYAQRYNSSGVAQGSEWKVNLIDSNQEYDACVAMDADGDFVVAWFTIFGVYAQRYASDGTTQGAQWRVNTLTPQGASPAIAMDSLGNFVIAWRDDEFDGAADIFAQRYASDGTTLGAQWLVNTEQFLNQYRPTIAMDSDGDFIIVWYGNQTSDYDIYAQRYASDGTTQGAEWRANTNVTGTQRYSTVDMDSNGNFVISWAGNQTGDYDIYAQRYNSSGTTQGAEWRVNQTTSGNQDTPVIALDADGNFVVTWAGMITNWNIYAQSFNSGGTVRGAEFQVNEYDALSQQYPAIGMDSNGKYLVSWSDYRDSNYDVYARRYGNNTSAGSNVVVTLGSVKVAFPTVTTEGYTSSTTVTADSGRPDGFSWLANARYDISTTAGYTGDVTITVTYNEDDLPAGVNESDLKIFHKVGSEFQDITVSVDTENNQVIGVTSSFSEFGVGYPSGNNPHGDYTETSDKCNDCHDVHEAAGAGSTTEDDSLFLSRWADGVNMTCLFCHDNSFPPNGTEAEMGAIFSTLNPYGDSPYTSSAAGYRHIEVLPAQAAFTYAPDQTRTASYPVPGGDFVLKSFQCASCHTPHRSSSKLIIAGFSDDTTSYESRDLLIKQPGRDSTDSAGAEVYGGRWCERCHTRRDSHPGLNNHPTGESSYAVSGLARSTQAFQMSPINPGVQRANPICQACHEDERQVDSPTSTAFPGALFVGVQSFPHEATQKYFLVEKRDDLCTNCHIADELP